MPLSEQEKNELKAKITEQFETASNIEGAITNLLYTAGYVSKAEKDEFIQIVKEMRPKADPGILNKLNEDKKLQKSFSSSEQKKRAEVSEKAFEAFVTGLYDHFSRYDVIDKAVEEGEISKDDLKKIGDSRDILNILTYGMHEPGRDQYNIDLIKMASGKGLDPNDPNTETDRKMMAATIWDARLQDLANADFSKYRNYTDEELIEHWPQIFEDHAKLAVILGELGRIQQNEYIDLSIIDKCRQQERRYSADYPYLISRMRAMASTDYQIIDLENLNKLDKEDYNNFAERVGFDDPENGRFILQTNTIRDSFAEIIGNRITNYMIDQQGLGCAENLLLLDEEGELIKNSPALVEMVKAGKPVFAVNLRDQKIVPVDCNLDKKIVKAAALTDRIRQGQNVVQNRLGTYLAKICTSMNDVIHTQANGAELNTFYVASELCSKPDLNKDEVVNNIIDHIKKPYSGLTKAQYIQQFKKSGFEPRLLSEEESSQRLALTERLTRLSIDNHMNRILAANVENKNLIQGMPQRVFETMCFTHKPENVHDNEQLIAKFFKSTDDAKEVVEEVFRYHLSKAAMFDRSYTDEELVDNWPSLCETGLAMGMEYINFTTALENMHIDIDPELKKQTDAYFKKVDAFNSYYRPRIDIIGSKYYQYGCEDACKDPEKIMEVMSTSQDPEFVRMKNSLFSANTSIRGALGSYFLDQNKYVDQDIVGFVSLDGEYFDGNDTYEAGKLVQEGKDIILIDRNNNLYPLHTQANGYPPVITDNPELGVIDKKIVETALAIRDIQNSNLDSYEITLRTNSLNSFKAFMGLLRNQNIDEYEDRFKEYLGNLATDLAIEKMAAGKNMDEENLKFVSSKEVHAKYRDSIFSSGLIDELVKLAKNNMDTLPSASPETMYKALVHCTTQLSLKEKQLSAKERQDRYIQFRDASKAKAKEISESLDPASNLSSKEGFFNNEFPAQVFEDLKRETNLTSMTVTRGSVQSLTLAMMLNSGYSVEDAFAPENAMARAVFGRNAMKLIRSNEAYVIRSEIIKGLSTLNDYVSDKLASMDDFSISEFAKPENRTLVSAAGFLKDLNQEYGNCQNQLPDNDKLDIPATHAVQLRAEILGYPASKFAQARYTPYNMSVGEITDELRHYVMGQMFNKYICDLKQQPENKGKKYEELMDLNKSVEVLNSMLMKSGEIEIPHEYRSPENLQKLHDAMQDDSLKNYLNISIAPPIEDNPDYSIEFTLETAIKNAANRDSLEKKIDLELDKPFKEQEFVMQ